MASRLLAMCDILGFRQLVQTLPLDALRGDVHVLRRLLGVCLRHDHMPEQPPTLSELREQARVGFSMFSDTMLIYAYDDTDVSCMNVLETVGWLVGHTVQTRTRIRAGVAYGEFHAAP